MIFLMMLKILLFSLMLAHSEMGGGHCTEKMYTGRGGRHTYFVDGGNSLGWGHHTILREQAETFQNLNFP